MDTNKSYKKVELVSFSTISAPMICFTMEIPNKVIDELGESIIIKLLAENYFNTHGQILRSSSKIDGESSQKFFQPITTLN